MLLLTKLSGLEGAAVREWGMYGEKMECEMNGVEHGGY